MSRIIIVSHYTRSLLNFRRELIEEMVGLGHEVIALGPEQGFEAQLEALGARYVPIPLRRTSLNPAGDLPTLAALVRLMRDTRPDIVFSYAAKPVIYGSLAARLAGVRRVHSMITGLGSAFIGEGDWRGRVLAGAVASLYRLALANNSAVFFQNPDDARLFEDWALLPERCRAVVIPGSGVNLTRFPYADAPVQPVSFLLAARLIRHKGIVEYVQAARMLKPRYPTVRFGLIGPFDTNLSALRRDEVERWAAEGVIEYLGETDDIYPYLAACSVYVLPSYREGTPRSVLEAMAVGRPIITTDAPGCRETVVEGLNGFLVPPRDSMALAVAMERFVQNPGIIRDMGRKSREMAEEKYDVRQVNRIILDTMGLV
ncbi:MAG: glycosyltransferase family 4 protein [Clostridia bacterium]|nr:glycosyltransferase family 4 protein [Clostridia bacterium]